MSIKKKKINNNELIQFSIYFRINKKIKIFSEIYIVSNLI
jgi:hypothetical protein